MWGGGGGANDCADLNSDRVEMQKKCCERLSHFGSSSDSISTRHLRSVSEPFDNMHMLSRLLWLFCVYVYNLMPLDMSLTLGQPISLLSHSHLCITTQTAERYWSEQSFLSLIGLGPNCSIFENLSSTSSLAELVVQ